ncbi:MAG: hypothetical protein GY820_35310 [Gammaproteobacteria bacterium]|nr:hypothetical protein [Gammaproteobacteria bacterium]
MYVGTDASLSITTLSVSDIPMTYGSLETSIVTGNDDAYENLNTGAVKISTSTIRLIMNQCSNTGNC